MNNECSGRCRFLSENTANTSVFRQNLGFGGGYHTNVYIYIYMSQPQNYQRPLYQRRFIQYWFFAFSLENDRGLTKNDTPEHGLCWTFELELPKSNLCTVPVLKAATCDLEVAASKQKPLRLTRDRRKLRPSSWSCRSVTCALRLW